MKTFISLFLVLLVYPQLAYCQTDEEFATFIPEGYTLLETACGDLNKDGGEDCILIIKGTAKEGFAENQFGDIVDKNRRGIIVLFHKNGRYESVIQNYDCFSSENEDGGVYFAPELEVYIEKGNLYVHYAHGRYGHWTYTFRFQNDDLELIGYDQADHFGPIVKRVISINFLTKKKKEVVNVNEYTEESGEEVFEETWYDIEVNKRIKLSEIEDFDYLSRGQF